MPACTSLRNDRAHLHRQPYRQPATAAAGPRQVTAKKPRPNPDSSRAAGRNSNKRARISASAWVVSGPELIEAPRGTPRDRDCSRLGSASAVRFANISCVTESWRDPRRSGRAPAAAAFSRGVKPQQRVPGMASVSPDCPAYVPARRLRGEKSRGAGSECTIAP